MTAVSFEADEAKPKPGMLGKSADNIDRKIKRGVDRNASRKPGGTVRLRFASLRMTEEALQLFRAFFDREKFSRAAPPGFA
jgi:hypothetical protein